ncbi:NPC intracellular cholesterol transporter 1-like [Brevipalpus obovatus]|uniref:NPC intracellular cholesterol transporter 1-like n=1 Tax=Brevipalpus obovatus TaxID=246614 RepID=UPI003D9E5067
MQSNCFHFISIVLFLHLHTGSGNQQDNQERRCAFDVKCSRYNLECSSNKNPQPLSENENKMLRDMCPSLVPSKTGPFDRVPLCCSSLTVGRLKVFLGYIREHFPNPGCWINFRQLFCQLFCSPHQADFVRIDSIQDPKEDDKELYVHIDYFLSERFSQSVYECCRDMKQLSDPYFDTILLVPIMCSRIHDGDLCTKVKWFRSIMHYRLPTIFDFRVVINYINNFSKPVLKNGQVFIPLDEAPYPCGGSSVDYDSYQNCDQTKSLAKNHSVVETHASSKLTVEVILTMSTELDESHFISLSGPPTAERFTKPKRGPNCRH